MKGSMIVCLFFLLGCLIGFGAHMQFDTHNLSMYILYALMFVPLSAQTPHTISGIVKDRASVPISGVNIRVEGQKWKASTGKEGKFTLEIPQNSTITFSPLP